MRQVSGERIDDGNRLAPVPDADVDVDSECLDPSGQPLQLLDEFCIALNGSHLGISPVANGMRSGTGQHRTAAARDSLKLRDCRSKVLLRLRHSGADARDHLHRRLHELVTDLRVLGDLAQRWQRGQDLASVLPQHPASAIDELQFPLDTQRRAARWVPPYGHSEPPWLYFPHHRRGASSAGKEQASASLPRPGRQAPVARAAGGWPEQTAADAVTPGKRRGGDHRRMPVARAAGGWPEQTAADAVTPGKRRGGDHRRMPVARAGRRLARADGRGAPGGEAPPVWGSGGYPPG